MARLLLEQLLDAFLLIQVFKTKIIDGAAAGKLSSNEVFKEYFRELYFKGEN
jgi:hypothetical protein